MEKKYYSNSRLETFDQCRLKYKFRYIDKIKPEIEKTIEAHLGDIVHETLEWIYTRVLENQIPTLDNAITFFSEKWQEKYFPEILIVKKELTEKDYFNKGIQFILDYYARHHPFADNTLEIEKKIVLKLVNINIYMG